MLGKLENGTCMLGKLTVLPHTLQLKTLKAALY